MPGHLRTRLRRALTGGQNDGGALSKIKHGRNSKFVEPESDFYQPGEKMPPLKYRRPVDPEHKKHLETFSFKTAWRRRSHQSLYSPMGSRLPSRRGSFRSRRSRSRSMHRSRRSSFSSDYDREDMVDSGIGASINGDERPANIKEASDDEGDVLNVGLSRNPTEDPRDARRKQSAANRQTSTTKATERPTTSSDHTHAPSQPFSPEDLELALERSHLEPARCDPADADDEACEPISQRPSEEYQDPDFVRPRGGSIYVPYDGQGTPPKLPFWGTAFPVSDNTTPVQQSRRASAFATFDDPSPMSFPRRESVFVPVQAPASPRLSQRRPSIFCPVDAPLPMPTPSSPVLAQRRPSIFVPCTSQLEQQQPQSPIQAQPKRKPPPCCPSDAIAAILARPD